MDDRETIVPAIRNPRVHPWGYGASHTAKGRREYHELAFLNHGNTRRFKEIKGKEVLE